jgi:hypothetical protein
MSYNKNLFNDKNIRFSSKKGQFNNVNQDNFFCIVDGETKIFGIFDGHGSNGNLVSNFVMGQMVDYIKHSEVFRKLKLFDQYHSNSVSDEDMKHAIRCAFQYAQERVRQQYYDYLIDKKRREVATKIHQQKRDVKKDRLYSEFKQSGGVINLDRVQDICQTPMTRFAERNKANLSKSNQKPNDVSPSPSKIDLNSLAIDSDELDSMTLSERMVGISDGRCQPSFEDMEMVDNMSWCTDSLKSDEEQIDEKPNRFDKRYKDMDQG